ncbi:Collectin-10 [Frankliniella fusca]|uniref:Collectin-10 n=1 Tax=Frankliniella fusca TaxID=407009 RepID=A0AAE1LGY3_9NEOP|nr:Collectin-10 [Frankliniella fusca]
MTWVSGAAQAGWSCVPGVGLFRVRGLSPGERANYTAAGERCRGDSGELAHVLSEVRTAGLAALMGEKGRDDKNRTVGPASRAYVDLADTAKEGLFVTSADEPLDCFPFRAWAPGEPRHRLPDDDCVVLQRRPGPGAGAGAGAPGGGGGGAWAVTDCRRKLPFICELYPGPGSGGDCDQEDEDAREACLSLRRLQGSPEDRCEGWDILAVPPAQPTTTAAPITPEYHDEDEQYGEGAGQGEQGDEEDEDDTVDAGRVSKRSAAALGGGR